MSELESAAIKVYKYAKIAVNQIICMGGDESCQPCENREQLAIALDELERALSGPTQGVYMSKWKKKDESTLTSAPADSCPAGGEHDWPETYLDSGCRKCGRSR